MRDPAGALAHRVQVTTVLDNRFDGDTASGNSIFSKEGKEEIAEYFGSREAYIGPGGKIRSSPFTETIERVLYALTGI